ncbi:MAG: hypothetical protein JW929_12290 [Anaerolineales bacterium]|nr:hypothetical protein [Anaerolineales bacterium]
MSKKSRALKANNRNIRIVTGIVFGIVVLIMAWIIVRPGIFVMPPNAEYRDGVVIVYHSRGNDMGFIASPDSVCVSLQGTSSQACRDLVLSEFDAVLNRMVLSLPYNEWLYLRSTGGVTYE